MSGQRAVGAIHRDELPRIAIVFNAGLALALAFVWVHQAMGEGFWQADFTSYYFGGSMVLEGHGDRLYDRHLQKQYQARIVPERGATDGLLGFNYPPHSALPAPLFALLPRGPAFHVWAFVQLLLLIPLFIFLRRLTDNPERLPFAILLTSVLAFPPLFISFQLGQVSILLLVCLLGFTCNLAAGRPFGTALWLTLGTIKPQMMVAPVAILLARRRWRELGIAALLMAIWGLVATALLGVSCWFAFVKMLQHSAQQFGQDGIHPLAMYNLKGFLTSVLGVESAARINILSVAFLLLAVLIIVALGRKPIPAGTAEWDLRLALSLQLGLLANPHFNPADALTLVAPAILFYRGLRRSGRSTRAVAAVLVFGPLLFALDCYGSMAARPMAIHPFFLLLVALAAAMAATLARIRSEASLAA